MGKRKYITLHCSVSNPEFVESDLELSVSQRNVLSELGVLRASDTSSSNPETIWTPIIIAIDSIDHMYDYKDYAIVGINAENYVIKERIRHIFKQIADAARTKDRKGRRKKTSRKARRKKHRS